jgi:uncharacterized protein
MMAPLGGPPALQHHSPRLLRLADVPAQPWRNGGGVTRELLAEAVQGSAWRWRLSVADITADGPFSEWPGVQRWFAVVQGQGVDLAFSGEQGELLHRQLHGDEPLCFDGGDAPACRLVDGATRDLNLMLRGSQGSMHCAKAGTAMPAWGGMAGLYAAGAGRVSSHDQQWEVPAEALLWFDTVPDALQWDAPPGVAAWWILVGGMGSPDQASADPSPPARSPMPSSTA